MVISDSTPITPFYYELLESVTDGLSKLSTNHTIEDGIRLGKVIDKLYELKLKIFKSNEKFPEKDQNPVALTVSNSALNDASKLHNLQATFSGMVSGQQKPSNKMLPRNQQKPPALNISNFPALNATSMLNCPQETFSKKVAGHIEQKPINQQPVHKESQIQRRMKESIVKLETLIPKNTMLEFKLSLPSCRDIHPILMNEMTIKKPRNRYNSKPSFLKKSFEECAEVSEYFYRFMQIFHETQNQSDHLLLMEDIKMAASNLIETLNKFVPES